MAQQDDACSLLDEDHNQAIRLFEQYKTAHENSRQVILARQLCHELAVHMQIEDEIFYPAFQRATGNTDRVQDSEREKMFPEARRTKGFDLERLAGQLTARKAELMAEHPA